jgi:hypothetical protein
MNVHDDDHFGSRIDEPPGNVAIVSTIDARVAAATGILEEVREVHDYAGNPQTGRFGTLVGSFSNVTVRSTLDDYDIGGFRSGVEVLFATPRAGLRPSCSPTASCFGDVRPGTSRATVRVPQFALESVTDLRNLAESLGIGALFEVESGNDVAFSSILLPARISYELTLNRPRTIDTITAGTLDHGVARKNELIVDRPFRVIVREPNIGVILYSAWITGGWKPAELCVTAHQTPSGIEPTLVKLLRPALTSPTPARRRRASSGTNAAAAASSLRSAHENSALLPRGWWRDARTRCGKTDLASQIRFSFAALIHQPFRAVPPNSSNRAPDHSRTSAHSNGPKARARPPSRSARAASNRPASLQRAP